MRRAIELLTRLERHALDQRRLELQAATAELACRCRQLVQLQHRVAAEHALAFELPGGPQPLAAYARLTQAQARTLRAEEARAGDAVAAAEAGLRRQARRWKTLDLVGLELRAREAARVQRTASAAVEEAAQVRAALRLRTRVPA